MHSVGADGLFAVNFSIDYLLLYFTDRVLGAGQRRRVFICAVLIALSETLTIFALPTTVCKALLWAARLGSAAILGMTEKRRPIVKGGVYLIWFVSLDEIVTSFMTSIFVRMPLTPPAEERFGAGFSSARLLPAIGVFLLLCTISILSRKKRGNGKKTVSLKIVFDKRELDCTALCDTGNLLKEPISGLPVVVIGKEAAKRLGNLEKETLLRSGKLRLVPAKTVSGSVLLAAFVPDLAKIDGKERRICVALDDQTTLYGGCEALIGADVL